MLMSCQLRFSTNVLAFNNKKNIVVLVTLTTAWILGLGHVINIYFLSLSIKVFLHNFYFNLSSSSMEQRVKAKTLGRQGVKAKLLGRQNEKNFCYDMLALTSIFGLCFMSVCLIKSNCYSFIYSSSRKTHLSLKKFEK